MDSRHPLDADFFQEELRKRLPPSLRPIFGHYEHLSPTMPRVFVLPDEVAAYLTFEHPRIPGSVQMGIDDQDGLVVLPNALSTEELTTQLRQSEIPSLFAFFEASPDAPAGQINDAIRKMADCVRALPDTGSLDLILPTGPLASTSGQDLRDALLARGKVTDLFDGGPYWYVGWLGEDLDPEHGTQAVKVPPADQWPEFIRDLDRSFLLWHWGYLTDLPPAQPWTWDALHPDYVSMILRLEQEVEATDSSTFAATSAYVRYALIEIYLRYLVHLRIGDDPQALLALLRPRSREKVEKMSGDSGTRPHENLDFIHFRQIMERGWVHFQPVFDPDGSVEKKHALPPIEAVNRIRQRTAHPGRLMAERITDEDLKLLDDCIVLLHQAAERAEALGPT